MSNSILHGKSAERLDPPSTSVEEKPLTPQAPNHKEQGKAEGATTWISDEANKGHGWKVPTKLLKAQGYGKRWKDCWVPKASYMRLPSSKSPNKQPKPSQSLRVHPTYKWVPKHSIPMPTPAPKPQTTTKEKPRFQWRPKTTNPPTKPIPPTPKKPPRHTNAMQWRPKLVKTKSQSTTRLNQVNPTHQPARTSANQSSIQWKSQMLQQLLQHKLSQPEVANRFASAIKAKSQSPTTKTKSTLYNHEARIAPTPT